MEHLTLQVAGMKCGGCEKTVEAAIGTLPGVFAVKAQHQQNAVELDYDTAQIDATTIKNAIRTAGYQVD